MLKHVILAVVALAALPFGIRLASHVWAATRITQHNQRAPSRAVAVVFGAGVRNGAPSPMLYDRVASAVDLYKRGSVSRLLMSGDGRRGSAGEPAVMRQTAIQLGVPARDILTDDLGASTYDTCRRARDVFDADEPVLVTQAFHLDRALLTCRLLGVNAIGYVADRRPYSSVAWNHLREVPATVNALVETLMTRPRPSLDSGHAAARGM